MVEAQTQVSCYRGDIHGYPAIGIVEKEMKRCFYEVNLFDDKCFRCLNIFNFI